VGGIEAAGLGLLPFVGVKMVVLLTVELAGRPVGRRLLSGAGVSGRRVGPVLSGRGWRPGTNGRFGSGAPGTQQTRMMRASAWAAWLDLQAGYNKLRTWRPGARGRRRGMDAVHYRRPTCSLVGGGGVGQQRGTDQRQGGAAGSARPGGRPGGAGRRAAALWWRPQGTRQAMMGPNDRPNHRASAGPTRGGA